MSKMRKGYQKGDASKAIEDAQRLSDAGAVKRFRKLDAQKMLKLESKPQAAGGFLTNRPPANRQGAELSEVPLTPSSFAGGEDMLEVSARVTWRNWESLGPKLAMCKQYAKQSKEEGDDENRNQVMLEGTTWAVASSGTKSTQEKGPVYSFVLLRGGIKIAIANRSAASGTFNNVRIIIGSIPLMLSDSRDVWAMVVREIDELGGTLEKAVVSRVDPCVDLVGVSVQTLTEMFRNDKYICRAVTDEDHTQNAIYRKHRKDTGFRIGQGIMLRVYDKLEETKTDDVKFQAVMLARWGGKMPEHATRVEFQIRREQLKSLGIDTVDDWFAKRSDVVAYLCTKWIRFTDKTPDRKNGNQHRAKTATIWTKITEAFAIWAGKAKTELKRIKLLRCDHQALKAQIGGTALTLVAKAVGFTRNVAEITAWVVDEVIKVIEAIPEKTLFKRLEKKRAAFDAQYPSDYIDRADTTRSVAEWLNEEPVAVNVFDREFTDEYVEFAKRAPSDHKWLGAFFKDQLPNLATG